MEPEQSEMEAIYGAAAVEPEQVPLPKGTAAGLVEPVPVGGGVQQPTAHQSQLGPEQRLAAAGVETAAAATEPVFLPVHQQTRPMVRAAALQPQAQQAQLPVALGAAQWQSIEGAGFPAPTVLGGGLVACAQRPAQLPLRPTLLAQQQQQQVQLPPPQQPTDGDVEFLPAYDADDSSQALQQGLPPGRHAGLSQGLSHPVSHGRLGAGGGGSSKLEFLPGFAPVEVFIGGLPPTAQDFDVFLALAKAGEVLSLKIFRRNKDRGDCRGYGLVCMASRSDAERAVAEVKEACGCAVAVTIPAAADVAALDEAVQKGPVVLQPVIGSLRTAVAADLTTGGDAAAASGGGQAGLGGSVGEEHSSAGQQQQHTAVQRQGSGGETVVGVVGGVTPQPTPPEGSMARMLRIIREHGDRKASVATAAFTTLLAIPGRPRLAFTPSRPFRPALAAHAAPLPLPVAAEGGLASGKASWPAPAAQQGPQQAQQGLQPERSQQQQQQQQQSSQQQGQDIAGLPTSSNYLDAYPRCKALMDKFQAGAKPGVAPKTPLQTVHEYASRLMLEVLYDERAETPLGPFSVEAKLAGQRGTQTFASGNGRARNKQLAKQVAAAALLESLLATVPEADFLVPGKSKENKAQYVNPRMGLGVPGRGAGGRGGRAAPVSGRGRGPSFVSGGRIQPDRDGAGFEFRPAGRPGYGDEQRQQAVASYPPQYSKQAPKFGLLDSSRIPTQQRAPQLYPPPAGYASGSGIAEGVNAVPIGSRQGVHATPTGGSATSGWQGAAAGAQYGSRFAAAEQYGSSGADGYGSTGAAGGRQGGEGSAAAYAINATPAAPAAVYGGAGFSAAAAQQQPQQEAFQAQQRAQPWAQQQGQHGYDAASYYGAASYGTAPGSGTYAAPSVSPYYPATDAQQSQQFTNSYQSQGQQPQQEGQQQQQDAAQSGQGASSTAAGTARQYISNASGSSNAQIAAAYATSTGRDEQQQQQQQQQQAGHAQQQAGVGSYGQASNGVYASNGAGYGSGQAVAGSGLRTDNSASLPAPNPYQQQVQGQQGGGSATHQTNGAGYSIAGYGAGYGYGGAGAYGTASSYYYGGSGEAVGYAAGPTGGSAYGSYGPGGSTAAAAAAAAYDPSNPGAAGYSGTGAAYDPANPSGAGYGGAAASTGQYYYGGGAGAGSQPASQAGAAAQQQYPGGTGGGNDNTYYQAY